MIKDSDAVRWWQKVIATDGCWHWTGAARSDAGYGMFWHAGRGVYPHRFGYELLRGPIPRGMTLDHLCKNPACVNPDHLEPVTMTENLMRGEGVGAKNAAKTHCKRGHPFDPENTMHDRRGRVCRECGRAKLRARRARVKAGSVDIGV